VQCCVNKREELVTNDAAKLAGRRQTRNATAAYRTKRNAWAIFDLEFGPATR
jgi:hypothetical protein